MNPLWHTLAALGIAAVFYFTPTLGLAMGLGFGAGWYCGREEAQWEKGSGYGFLAWFLPLSVCYLIKLLLVP